MESDAFGIIVLALSVVMWGVAYGYYREGDKLWQKGLDALAEAIAHHDECDAEGGGEVTRGSMQVRGGAIVRLDDRYEDSLEGNYACTDLPDGDYVVAPTGEDSGETCERCQGTGNGTHGLAYAPAIPCPDCPPANPAQGEES